MSTQDDNVYATVLRSPVSCEIARDRVIFRLTGGREPPAQSGGGG